MSGRSERREFKEGWPIISAAAVGVGLGLSPLPFYTIGVFIPPMLEEFGSQGWTPGDILNAIAIYTFGGLFAAPVIGLLTERFGARRVALVSIVTFSLAMMSLSLNTGNRVLYGFLWLVLAAAGAGTLPITFTRPVANWFHHNRGMALGIALIATGVYGALAKLFAQQIIHLADWRMAYVALGMLPLAIVLPMAWLAFRDIDDQPARDAAVIRFKTPVMMISLVATAGLIWIVLRQILPMVAGEGLQLQYIMAFLFMGIALLPVLGFIFLRIGTEPPITRTTPGKVELSGLTLKQSLATWRFWLLATSFVGISYGVGAIIPNIERVLTAGGFSMDQAVGLATLTGLAVLGGRIIGGYLIDRFWAPGVAFAFLASPAIALWMLGHADLTSTKATSAILMIGFGAGVEYDFMAYMITKYFGMRSYSAVYGAIYAFFGIGAGFGPTILTRSADAYGWGPTLSYSAIVLFVSALPLLALGRYRDFDGEQRRASKADEKPFAKSTIATS